MVLNLSAASSLVLVVMNDWCAQTCDVVLFRLVITSRRRW